MKIVALLLAAGVSAATPKPVEVIASDGVAIMSVYPDGSYTCLKNPTPGELAWLIKDGGARLLIYATACGEKK